MAKKERQQRDDDEVDTAGKVRQLVHVEHGVDQEEEQLETAHNDRTDGEVIIVQDVNGHCRSSDQQQVLVALFFNIAKCFAFTALHSHFHFHFRFTTATFHNVCLHSLVGGWLAGMGSGGAAFIAEWLAASQGVSPPFLLYFFWAAC